MLVENEATFISALKADLNKPVQETIMAEIDFLRYIEVVTRCLKGVVTRCLKGIVTSNTWAWLVLAIGCKLSIV